MVMKKRYRYSCSTTVLWASFVFGEVEAEDREHARDKALAELKYNFEKANDALAHCDTTIDFTIEFNKDAIEIEPID